MPMYVCHIGIQSMWKGTHSAEQVRNGVWGAMLAREGMTGPHMPFEARDGLWAHIGAPTRDLVLPASPDGRLQIELIHGNGGGYKRVATEGNNQTFHQTIAPEIYEVDEAGRYRFNRRRVPLLWLAGNLRPAEVGPAESRDGRPQRSIQRGPDAAGRKDLLRFLYQGEVHGSKGERTDGQDHLQPEPSEPGHLRRHQE